MGGIVIDIDLSTPVNQVRALIGDPDGRFISDSNITFLLTQNNDDVILAAEQALKYIVNMVATYVREETGDVEVWWEQLYEQLSARLDKLEKDSRYKKSAHLFYFGGTNKTEMKRVRSNPNSVGIGFTPQEFYKVLDHYGFEYTLTYDSPYTFV